MLPEYEYEYEASTDDADCTMAAGHLRWERARHPERFTALGERF
jgi:hypothetical protein